MEEPLLAASGVRKVFPGPGGGLEVLKGLDLAIRRGEISFILGRSGSGKSTLLHLLASLDRPTEGCIIFRGRDLGTLSERELARYRNQNLGFIFQFYYLLPELNLLENVMLPARMARKKDIRKNALRLLEKMGLEKRAGHLPSQLSGGEQQRAAIARALVNGPDIVFCDEPTGNLDEETADQVWNLLLDLNREEGQTLCVVTHDEGLVRRAADQMLQSPEAKPKGRAHVHYLHEGRLTLKNSHVAR